MYIDSFLCHIFPTLIGYYYLFFYIIVLGAIYYLKTIIDNCTNYIRSDNSSSLYCLYASAASINTAFLQKSFSSFSIYSAAVNQIKGIPSFSFSGTNCVLKSGTPFFTSFLIFTVNS